jgi:hypothetical protein
MRRLAGVERIEAFRTFGSISRIYASRSCGNNFIRSSEQRWASSRRDVVSDGVSR